MLRLDNSNLVSILLELPQQVRTKIGLTSKKDCLICFRQVELKKKNWKSTMSKVNEERVTTLPI